MGGSHGSLVSVATFAGDYPTTELANACLHPAGVWDTPTEEQAALMTTLLIIFLVGCADPGRQGDDSGSPGGSDSSCLIGAIYETDSASDGTVDWESVFTYNTAGEALTDVESQVEDGTAEISDDYTWEYDDAGFMVLWVSGPDTNGIEYSVALTYDDHGNPLMEEFTHTDLGTALATFDYTYDADGNAIGIAITYQGWDGESSTTDWAYTYDSRGNVVTSVHDYESSDSGGGTETVIRTFDEHDNVLTSDTTYAGESSTNTTHTDYSYTYDSEYNVLTKVTTADGGGVWTDTFTYDQDHNILTHVNVGNGSGQTYTNTYTFGPGPADCSRTAITADFWS